MSVDLSKCKEGQKLLSSHGLILEYVGVLPEDDYYDHQIKYPDGSLGTRANDGHVFRKRRMPETDHDIIKILDS